MRLAIGLVATALASYGCDRMLPAAHRADAKERLEQVRKACASQLTYARLKEYVFDEAARIRNSDPRRLDALAAYSVVRMDDPVVKTRDEDLNVTVCTGRFVLNLPPGIQDAFDSQSVIEADVEYAAQAAADGSGLVYSMNGAEPIIYRIATLGLPTRPAPRIAAAPSVVEPSKDAPDVAVAKDVAEQKAVIPPAVDQAKTRIAAPERRPEAAPKREPVRQATAVPKREPVRQATAVPKREPVRQARAATNPSFNCRYAKTGSERMVCGSGSLAAADRRMSAVYYSEMASADAAVKRALRRTRDKFLARRDRCSTEACVARIYAERVTEIRRIANQ